jgi:Fe2+ or Zn2+ uptake regulation protein
VIDVSNLLQGHGIRPTRQRIRVAEVLLASAVHT